MDSLFSPFIVSCPNPLDPNLAVAVSHKQRNSSRGLSQNKKRNSNL